MHRFHDVSRGSTHDTRYCLVGCIQTIIHAVYPAIDPSQTIFLDKKSFHSVSPQELDISFATRPSKRTVGETWIPFCLLNLTDTVSIDMVGQSEGYLTSVLQVFSDVNSAVRGGLVREEIQYSLALIRADHRGCEVCELTSDLLDREARGRDIEEIVLLFKELKPNNSATNRMIAIAE